MSLRQACMALCTQFSRSLSRGGATCALFLQPHLAVCRRPLKKSILVVPLLQRVGDQAPFDSCRFISLASCAVHARIEPHISP